MDVTAKAVARWTRRRYGKPPEFSRDRVTLRASRPHLFYGNTDSDIDSGGDDSQSDAVLATGGTCEASVLLSAMPTNILEVVEWCEEQVYGDDSSSAELISQTPRRLLAYWLAVVILRSITAIVVPQQTGCATVSEEAWSIWRSASLKRV